MTTMELPKKLLMNEVEASEKLGLKLSGLRNARRRGEIDYCQVGRRIFYTMEQLKNYLKSIQIL